MQSIPSKKTVTGSHAFGMVMDGRSFAAGSGYRYGFNGKEKDGETYEGSVAFEERILDTRLGRWLSLDPKWKFYPSISAYSFGKNNPIFHIDEGGNDVIGYLKLMIETCFKPSILVLIQSEMYKNFINKFVNTASGDQLPYGATESGVYSKINLSFEAISNTEMEKRSADISGVGHLDGATSLSITDKGGNVIDLATYKGEIKDLTFGINVWINKENLKAANGTEFTKNFLEAKFGGALLMCHELAHAEQYAQIVTQLQKAEITIEKFMEVRKIIELNLGQTLHSQINQNKNSLFKEMVNEIGQSFAKSGTGNNYMLERGFSQNGQVMKNTLVKSNSNDIWNQQVENLKASYNVDGTNHDLNNDVSIEMDKREIPKDPSIQLYEKVTKKL